MKTKSFCVGHVPPLFEPTHPYTMLCPTALGLPKEMVIDDHRFGWGPYGDTLAEYSQLFGLAELLTAGEITAENLYLYQYRKFISPKVGGYDSVAPWVKVLSQQSAKLIFPTINDIEYQPFDCTFGAIYDFKDSIPTNYALVHHVEDFVCFAAACAQSGEFENSLLRDLAHTRGIIPSPTLCVIKTDLFIEMMRKLSFVAKIYLNEYHIQRTGYQRRAIGYMLERLHSIMIFAMIKDSKNPLNAGIWNRYVINSEL